ncbi:hypothetical protein IEO21_04754 [Rhodonia placenta]|uniref:Uncharacterized protein n=1 Tax=Rhodonia placenta TaxID=104341 RepID=A0A8H7U2X7_9APHY|nr:hypothetical protein IEO21_04754 [Postia placenta]
MTSLCKLELHRSPLARQVLLPDYPFDRLLLERKSGDPFCFAVKEWYSRAPNVHVDTLLLISDNTVACAPTSPAMATVAAGYVGGAAYDDHPELEPDLQWKNDLRQKIQDQLRHLVDDARQQRDSQWIHHPADSHSAAANDIASQKYQVIMTDIRRLAQDQYEEALERERLERRWAAGYPVDQSWIEAAAREQEAMLTAVHNGRQQTHAGFTFKPHDEPVAGPSRLAGRSTSGDGSVSHHYSRFLEYELNARQSSTDWYGHSYGEGSGESSRPSATPGGPWPRGGISAPNDSTIRQHHVDARAKARQVPEIWRPSAPADDRTPRQSVTSRPTPSSVKIADRPITQDRPSSRLKRKASEGDDADPGHSAEELIPAHNAVAPLAEAEAVIARQINFAVKLAQEEARKTPQLRPIVPLHLAPHFSDRSHSATPKPPLSFRVAPTPLRAVENMNYEQAAEHRTPIGIHFPPMTSAFRASAATPNPMLPLRGMGVPPNPTVHFEQTVAEQREIVIPPPPISSTLRAAAATPHPGARAPSASASAGTAMQVVDPRSFTLDDDRSSIHAPFQPQSVLGRDRSDTLRGVQLPAPSSHMWIPPMGSSLDTSSSGSSEPQRTPTLDEMVLVASDEGDSDWEASAFDTEDVDQMMKQGMEQFMVTGESSIERLLSAQDTIISELAPEEAVEVEVEAAPMKPVEVETETEKEDTPKKAKGGKAKRKEEAKRKEQDAKQKVQDTKPKVQDTKQKAQDAKQKAQEAKYKEQEDAKRRLELKRKEDEEARRREAESRQRMEDERRRELLRKREEDEAAAAAAREAERLNEQRLLEFRRQQEETRRRFEGRQRTDSTTRVPDALKKQQEVKKAEQAIGKKDADAGRKEEEARRREDDIRRKEEEIRHKEEDLMLREQEMAKRESLEDARRKEEEKRRKPGAPRKTDIVCRLFHVALDRAGMFLHDASATAMFVR